MIHFWGSFGMFLGKSAGFAQLCLDLNSISLSHHVFQQMFCGISLDKVLQCCHGHSFKLYDLSLFGRIHPSLTSDLSPCLCCWESTYSMMLLSPCFITVVVLAGWWTVLLEFYATAWWLLSFNFNCNFSCSSLDFKVWFLSWHAGLLKKTVYTWPQSVQNYFADISFLFLAGKWTCNTAKCRKSDVVRYKSNIYHTMIIWHIKVLTRQILESTTQLFVSREFECFSL